MFHVPFQRGQERKRNRHQTREQMGQNGKKEGRNSAKSTPACPSFLLSGFPSIRSISLKLPAGFCPRPSLFSVELMTEAEERLGQLSSAGPHLVHLPVRPVSHQFNQLKDASGILEDKRRPSGISGTTGR